MPQNESINLDCLAQNNDISIVKLVNIHSMSPIISYANIGFTQLTGYSSEEIASVLNGHFFELLEKDAIDYLIGIYHNSHKNTSYQYTYKIHKKTGLTVWVMDTGFFFINENGEECCQMILTDITDLKTNHDALIISRERLITGLKSSKTCIFEIDLTGKLYTIFENSEVIFGIDADEIVKEAGMFSKLSHTEYQKVVFKYFSHPGDSDVIVKAFENISSGIPTTYEARLKVNNTKFVWCKVDVTPIIENDIPIRMIGVITNIDSVKKKTDLLQLKANLDPATGLYNKKSAAFLIKREIKRSTDRQHALIFVDLDGFKVANDTHGHSAGDDIILNVSKNLKRVFKQNAVIGRFGGDEFIIFVRNIPSHRFVVSKLEKLLEQDNKYNVTKSIGVSFFPQDGTDYMTLFKIADLALYKSKIKKNTYTLSNDIALAKKKNYKILYSHMKK